MIFVDTHVHLDDSRYDRDREELIARAAAAGVGTLVTIGTCLEDSRWAAAFASSRTGVLAAVGVHPERCETHEAAHLGELEKLARSKGVVAVGEVGLDYHSPGFDKAGQEAVFRSMIGLARGAKLPLVIHNREAAPDVLRILREDWDPSLGGVFHCFAGDFQTARAVLDLNFDIAVGGTLTFKNAGALREAVAKVPLERLVLETDGPWLAPQAWRGKRNEPAYIPLVAAQLAALKGVGVDEVAEATTANARRLFRL